MAVASIFFTKVNWQVLTGLFDKASFQNSKFEIKNILRIKNTIFINYKIDQLESFLFSVLRNVVRCTLSKIVNKKYTSKNISAKETAFALLFKP